MVRVEKAKFLSRGKFSEELLRTSATAVTALYKNAGFSSVTVMPQVTDAEPQVSVVFNIAEGPRDMIAAFHMVDAQGKATTAPTATQSLNLGEGKPYAPVLLEQDRNQILAAAFNDGYLNAKFNSMVTPVAGEQHRFDVVYTLDRGPQAQVKDAVLLGNQRTRPSLIRSMTGDNVRENTPVSEGKFLTAEGDLYTLGIFDWADIHTRRPIAEQTKEDVLILVHEAKRNTIEFGGGIEVIPRSGNIPVGTVALPGLPVIGLGTKFQASQNSFFGPRASVQFTRQNIRGRAETGSVAVVGSRLDQRISLTYKDPRFRGLDWSSLFGLSVERTTENPIYTAELGQTSFQVQRTLDAKRTKTLIFRYNFQYTRLSKIAIPGLVLPEDQKVRLSTLSTEYIRDSRDKPLDAHHGVHQIFDFGVTPRALGSSANFVRFLGQNSVYVPVKPWLTWATRVRLGLAVPFSGSRVPLSERFFSGGADSLRGFPINGAGPQRPVQVCSNPADAGAAI